jgi:hypothetical protein
VLGVTLSLALVFAVPQGFVDHTAEGKPALGRLAAHISLPARATVKRIATDESYGFVKAASWAYTLPMSAPVGPEFLDGLARGLQKMGVEKPATALSLKSQRLVELQGRQGGRVDADLTLEEKRLREILFYAPGDGEVAVMVFICPLDDLPRYEPRFVAAAEGRDSPAPPTWRRALPLVAGVVLLVGLALLGLRARRQLTRSAAG